MVVTRIEEFSGKRKKVYLDQRFAFVLYKGEFRTYHVEEGQVLSEADYRMIMEEVLPKRAKLRAMSLLQSRDYTVKQLTDKLREGLYPPEIIEEAIAYASSYHYIDDLRYAVDYITAYESSRSARRIEHDLLKKGIDREVMRAAWREWERKGGQQDENAMICALLEKRHYDPETAEPGEWRRIYAFLLRRGFSPESVERAMNAYKPS